MPKEPLQRLQSYDQAHCHFKFCANNVIVLIVFSCKQTQLLYKTMQTVSISRKCGRTHGAPFRGYGYVPLRNGGNVVTRIGTQQQQIYIKSGEPGLVDRVLVLHAGSRGFDSHRGHMSEQVFRSNRPGYPHPVSSELENSGIRVAVGDCSVTERRRWRPPYQTGKAVHVHAKHYKHNED